MRIAVYGNSFAEGPWSPEAVVPPSWIDQVGKRFNAEVKTFGKGGTPMVYSYQRFLENYKDYDLNIFLVTHWQNYTKVTTFYYKDGSSEDLKMHSLLNVETFIEKHKNDLTDVSLEMANHIRGWFIAADDDYMILTWELMLKHMESLDPKIVFIPTCNFYHPENTLDGQNYKINDFQWSDNRRKQQLDNRGTMDYLRLQTASFGESYKDFFKKNPGKPLVENSDVIACHFTPETNIVFGNQVYELIVNQAWPDLPEKIEQEHGLDHYYKI